MHASVTRHGRPTVHRTLADRCQGGGRDPEGLAVMRGELALRAIAHTVTARTS
ncbi:MAG: hypothetical protein ACRDRU_14025 [Pseudonocardiaceae bacterium]